MYVGAASVLMTALLWMFVKTPRASITLVLVLAVLEGSREWPVPLGTSIGSINVSWADVVTALMGGVALARMAWRHIIRPARGGILGMTAMIGVGLVSWVLLLGLQPGVNFWRAWTFAVAATLYAASTPRLGEPGGLRPFVWAGALASLTQVIGIARRGFGSNMDDVIVNGELVSARPITASVALIMLIGMIVLLLDGRKVSLPKASLSSWLAVSIVLSQHRSVWVAAAVAGLLVVRALVSTSRQRLVAGTFAGLGAAAVALAVTAVVRSQPQLSVSASSTGTLDWRFENWTEKLTTERSTLEWLVGSVFGPTPLSDPGANVLFKVSSHSIYVETITTLGVLGLVLLVLVVVGAIRGSRRSTPERVVSLPCLLTGSSTSGRPSRGLWWGWLLPGSACGGRDATGWESPGRTAARRPESIAGRLTSSKAAPL